MAEERVSVPNIGDAHDVAVVEVLVAPGAKVDKDQPLVVLESDKASMEIPSPHAGTVKEISVKVGDSVSEGSALLVLETEAEAEPKAESKAKPKEEGKTEPKPAATEKQAGAEAEREVEQAEQQPSKGSQGQPSAEDAAAQQEPAEQQAQDGEGAREAPPEKERPPTRTIPPAPPVIPSSPPPRPGATLPYASPAIRRFARELGVDLTNVAGTGKHGRITKDDLLGYVKKALHGGGAGTVGLAIADAPDIDFSKFGETSLQPLTKIQRLTGKNLHRSWVTIPHVTQFDEADITELEAFRKKLREKPTELKLTLLTFLMKAVVAALKAMPRFNSSLDKTGENLILKNYYHLGVAVDTPNGLVVPVIRDVDKKSLSQLAKELEEVSERARARRLSPNDLQGASMTISSLGGIGGTAFTPIINPPEVAVLGVSRAKLSPVYVDGQFVPRLLCPLSLSYDHRVIDGADAARFTKQLGEYLADIRQLLL